MTLSLKLKIAFWAFLVLVLAIFLFLYIPYLHVRLIVGTYNRWTSPSIGRGGLLKLLFASKYGTAKLKEIIAKDCNMTIEGPNGYVEYGSGYVAIDSLKGKWFVSNVDRIILSGPVIEPNSDGYTATMTELIYEKSEIALWEIELFVKKYGGEYLISNIKWTLKNPTGEELTKLQNKIKVKWYLSYKGFGGRYNEPYTFSEPSFSPDGKKIAFSSLYPSSDIYIVNIDGSSLKKLTDTKYWEVLPQFSPDGKSIIFLSDKENYGGEYYIIDSDGSNYRRLVPGYFGVSEARFSPDGRYVAFIAQKGLSREVYIMNSDDTNVKQLTNNGNKCSSLVFSPDSKKLFFVQRWYNPILNEEIFSIKIDGTGLKQLTHARNENAHIGKVIDITKDSIFFLRDTYEYHDAPEVWKMDYDGGDQSKILGVGSHGPHSEAKVLPNKKAIVFVDDYERQYLYRLQIKGLDDSGEIRQIANDEVYSKIDISPDGKYVAYSILPRIYSRIDEIRNLNIVSIDGKESWTIGIK